MLQRALVILALVAAAATLILGWKDGFFVFSAFGLGIPVLMMVFELLRIIKYCFVDTYHTGGQAVRHWICIFSLLIMMVNYVGLIWREWFFPTLVWWLTILLFIMHQVEHYLDKNTAQRKGK